MRLVDDPLPPYSYVPGLFPHPVSDSRGHGFEADPADAAIEPENWRDCRTYLLGCDLFNHGYYWESHECWEAVWHRAGRRGLVADFCKSLIKLAAALVKAREGRIAGIARHARRSRTLLSSISDRTGGQAFMGLSLEPLIDAAASIAEHPERYVDVRPEPVVVVVSFKLIPGKEPERTRDA